MVGLIEWFRPGERLQVERVLRDCKDLGVEHLRTGISWADWHTPEGRDWLEWLIPELGEALTLLPCFTYTPPSLGIEPKTSAPPRNPKAYADFLDVMITDFGQYFEWVELWNEPNNLNDWDWRLDPQWHVFSEMIGGAAYWARERGKKTALAGMAPTDPYWLRLMAERGVLEHIDAVGMHAFPGTWEFGGKDWDTKIAEVRAVLEDFDLRPELWVTEVGYSTWRFEEREQVRVFLDTLNAPVDRIYWYSAYDLHPELEHQDGFHEDERHYHFGLKDAENMPKLLYRLWAEEGLTGLEKQAWLMKPAPRTFLQEKPVLVTGGSGFVGTNLAHRLLTQGRKVLLLDNLSRPGVEKNLRWLKGAHGDRVQIEIADLRNPYALRHLVENVSAVFHLAAQVAVTTSLERPRLDFDINLKGTLNLLEALRGLDEPPPLLFTSTNKVYGDLGGLELVEEATRYTPIDPLVEASGVSERTPLDFHSPYGVSKGGADQYVLDYARSYGLKTAAFRMSCIYGPHQFGTEDQGWVAHFLIRAIENKPITLYGDGKQVRDILFVEDLVDAFLLALENIDSLSGQAFNIGGGPEHTTSLLELLGLIAELQGEKPAYDLEPWRLGDQRYYVSGTDKFQGATGWRPQTGVREGVRQLYEWLLESRSLKPHLARQA